MVLFVNNDGTIIQSTASVVAQGSDNASELYLVCPFAESSSATVAFEKADGTLPEPVLMNFDRTFEIDGSNGEKMKVHGWKATIPGNVVNRYGSVSMQFAFYYANGAIRRTQTASFVVSRGVPFLLPETPTQDVYEKILSDLTDIRLGNYAGKAFYEYTPGSTYGKGMVTIADKEGQAYFVVSLVDDNTNPPFDNGTLSEGWDIISATGGGGGGGGGGNVIFLTSSSTQNQIQTAFEAFANRTAIVILSREGNDGIRHYVPCRGLQTLSQNVGYRIIFDFASYDTGTITRCIFKIGVATQGQWLYEEEDLPLVADNTVGHLNFGSKQFDGSTNVELTAEDLGISVDEERISFIEENLGNTTTQAQANATAINSIQNTSIPNIIGKVEAVEAVVPTEASVSNKLVDRATLENVVQSATGSFRGNWDTWAAVPTNVGLYPPDSSGNTTPSTNDYITLQNASSYNTSYSGAWRFKYTGTWSTAGKNGWKPEYKVADEAFTPAQTAAINSTITKDKVDGYDASITDISGRVEAVESVIPETASGTNKLATNEDFQDVSEIATAAKNRIDEYDNLSIISKVNSSINQLVSHSTKIRNLETWQTSINSYIPVGTTQENHLMNEDGVLELLGESAFDKALMVYKEGQTYNQGNIVISPMGIPADVETDVKKYGFALCLVEENLNPPFINGLINDRGGWSFVGEVLDPFEYVNIVEYNDAIDEINSDIADLQDRLDSTDDSISNITGRVSTLETFRTSASENLATLNTAVEPIPGIVGKLSTNASESNKLLSESDVIDIVQTSAGYFRGNWATWAAVPTASADYPVDPQGSHTPTNNDYIVIENASDYSTTTKGTWRFKYTGSWNAGKIGWKPEYRLNEEAFTTAQMAAINSGITETTLGTLTSDVSTASSNASSALSKATNAQTNATNALNVATDAETTANTADSNATTALSTANSAKSTAEEALERANQTYVIPVGGIPKTDLASAVQSSLNKADTALQSFTEVDPTVPAWAKESTKPTYTASEVGARPSTWTPTKSDIGLGNVGNFKAVSTVANQGLTTSEKSNARTNIGAGTYSKASTGIPKSDLASAIQTSLDKADSALQESVYRITDSSTNAQIEAGNSYALNGKRKVEYVSSGNIFTLSSYSSTYMEFSAINSSSTFDNYSQEFVSFDKVGSTWSKSSRVEQQGTGKKLLFGTKSFNGTVEQRITASDLDTVAIESQYRASAGYHNNIYRGKDITSYLTDGSLSNRIAGTGGYSMFEDIYIGDYFIVNIPGYGDVTTRWRVASFDHYFRTGPDTDILTTHHIVLVPDRRLFYSKMRTTDTTVGGYAGSLMHCSTEGDLTTFGTGVLSVLDAAIETTSLGGHIIEYSQNLTTGISSALSMIGAGTYGTATQTAWYSVKSCLMSDIAIFGGRVCSSSYLDSGIDVRQYPLFRLAPEYVIAQNLQFWLQSNRDTTSLRSITTDSSFAYVSIYGTCRALQSSNSGGIRPFILVK